MNLIEIGGMVIELPHGLLILWFNEHSHPVHFNYLSYN